MDSPSLAPEQAAANNKNPANGNRSRTLSPPYGSLPAQDAATLFRPSIPQPPPDREPEPRGTAGFRRPRVFGIMCAKSIYPDESSPRTFPKEAK